jgi:siroheme decarboxylase
MDAIDKKILNILQTGFPLDAEPYRIVAEQVGIDEDEVLLRVRKLKEEGVIRRIGAVFEPRALGYVSTLCAAKVPFPKVKEFVEAANSYPGVTHNYRRSHDYNVWFTFIAPSRKEIDKALGEIKEKTGIADILDMPAKRVFKIDASF